MRSQYSLLISSRLSMQQPAALSAGVTNTRWRWESCGTLRVDLCARTSNNWPQCGFPELPIEQHNKKAASRSESVDLPRGPANRPHAAASHEPHLTYGVLVLSGDAPYCADRHRSRHLSRPSGQNIPFLAPPIIKFLRSCLLVASCFRVFQQLLWENPYLDVKVKRKWSLTCCFFVSSKSLWRYWGFIWLNRHLTLQLCISKTLHQLLLSDFIIFLGYRLSLKLHSKDTRAPWPNTSWPHPAQVSTWRTAGMSFTQLL